MSRSYLGMIKLSKQEWDEIARVKAVTDLVTLSVETNVVKPPPEMAVYPVCEYSLVWSAKLAAARKDPATIDKDSETESIPVIQGQRLTGKFG